jgi:hypothetical protein
MKFPLKDCPSTPARSGLNIAENAGVVIRFLFLVTVSTWGLWTLPVVQDPGGGFGVSRAEGPSSPAIASSAVSMRVLWTVSGYKVGQGAVWGEDEARKMLLKPLDIEAAAITFDGRTCRDVTFRKTMVSAQEYLSRVYHATPQALGIEQGEVEVIRTNCDLPGFAEYVRLQDRRLVIHLNGVFFYFEPAVNY